MKSALTRLPLLLGASLALCVWSWPGVAVAAKHKRPPATHGPTTPAQLQYLEQVKTVAPKRHTRTGSGTTPTSSHTGKAPGSRSKKGTGRHTTTGRHHRPTSRGTKKPRPNRTLTDLHRATHLRGSRRSHNATGLTVAAATGSGGGLGTWLLVILAVVLVTGSVAGIFRYRRTR